MANKASGGCLCGKVRFHVEMDAQGVSICHCAMCRRWTGGPMPGLHPEGPVAIDGEDQLVWYKSSEWAERGFCGTCGSSLFYRMKDIEPSYVIAAGAFDDASAFKIENQIFIDEKPAYYDFAGDIPAMTGAEVFALYAPATASDEESQ